MNMPRVTFDHWQSRLEAACHASENFRHAFTLAETPSTQDAPQTRDARAGSVIATWRQTAGRGRFGRAWEDTASAGVAATFVVHTQAAERLALASAIAAAETCEHALSNAGAITTVGIKWPNDIVVAGQKLAGVLIETRENRAFIGIGINVMQARFEGELESRATSLSMLGSVTDRLDVLCVLLTSLARALGSSDDTLIAAFLRRDALRGTRALFATPTGPVEGEVCSIDPMRGLVVRTDVGERFLPAHSTSVAQWGGRVVRSLGT